MKLRYYLKDNEKIYTLKNDINNNKTKDAHYKFIKIKSVRPSESSEITHASQ
jgi:hypothetical protein